MTPPFKLVARSPSSGLASHRRSPDRQGPAASPATPASTATEANENEQPEQCKRLDNCQPGGMGMHNGQHCTLCIRTFIERQNPACGRRRRYRRVKASLYYHDSYRRYIRSDYEDRRLVDIAGSVGRYLICKIWIARW